MSRSPEFDLGRRCGNHTEEWDEKWIVHFTDETGTYLEGHYKDPNANLPAIRGERGGWSRHYWCYNGNGTRDMRNASPSNRTMVRIRYQPCDLTCTSEKSTFQATDSPLGENVFVYPSPGTAVVPSGF